MSQFPVATTDVRGGWTSASSAAADAACPGRHIAQRGLTSPQSDDAAHGSAIHRALAIRDSAGLTLDQQEVYDDIVRIEDLKVKELFAQLGGTPKVTREQRLWVTFMDQVSKRQFSHSCQYDVLYRLETLGLLVEYKSLQGDVPESPRNLQLRDQVVIVAGQPAALLTEVAVMVIQPLVTHTPEVTLYQTADIAKARDEMFARVAASNNPNSKRIAGELQCKYCLAKRRCPEYQQFAGSNLPTMLTLLDVPVDQWTPAQRGFFLDRASVAQKWLDDCKDAMKAGLAKDDAFVDGWKLKPGNKREVVTDPQECFARFVKLGGTPEQFLTTVSVGKTKLKEAVNVVTQKKGKALDAELAQLVAGISETTQNAPMLEKVEVP